MSRKLTPPRILRIKRNRTSGNLRGEKFLIDEQKRKKLRMRIAYQKIADQLGTKRHRTRSLKTHTHVNTGKLVTASAEN